ncbi:AraC family transcriptional regulator [Rhizobium sp. L1K21]|uniref:helix-turn-helix domain-containing protein n=1 Tax=Rhizobium sp. L1K21 TaxID=2954933 RepID=UPI00209217F0|nr:AraC family transcriptional regulator [Rhizobium sp. L1K21]MCO6184790.1 AraC family transcriptional regulator [Rhizobium sp. L1K21]
MTDRYTAAAGIGAALEDYAAGYGIDIVPLCQSLGMDVKVFHDIVGRISIDRFCRLLEMCAAKAGDDAFGLKYSNVYPFGATGPYGYGLMVAPNVREFLRFQQRHMAYVSETSYCRFETNEGGAVFHWSFSPIILQRDQFVDLGVALVVGALRRLAGSAVAAIEVGLERPKPRDFGPFREYITRNIHFGQDMNWLRAPRALLEVENPRADARLFELMDIQCQTMHPSVTDEDELLKMTRDYVTTRLRDDHVTLAEVAEFFNVSERTLQRRLSSLGTSLNDIRDDVRRELAGKFLTETALSATDICYRLGYSAPSAFTRSFYRWYGQTPRDFRKKAR